MVIVIHMARAMNPNVKLGAGETQSLTCTDPNLGDSLLAGHLMHSSEPGWSW